MDTPENTNMNYTDQSSWRSYPSVFQLGHVAITELFLDPVLVEEKIDGSQFSFGRFDGVLKARSKGKELIIDAPEKMFQLAVDEISKLDLINGWTYRGEYLSKPHHNTLTYSRVPKHNVILFDINIGHEEYLDYAGLVEEANRIGMEVVPRLGEGKMESPAHLLSFLETESILGGTKIEGMVFKNYARMGKDKKALMGKYVSEAFKEKHSAEWKINNPNSGDIVQRLILTYKTEARWQKAVQHLREAGKLTNTPQDIGALMKEVPVDVIKECEAEIKEVLFKWGWDHMRRGLTAGLPEWYKKQLMEGQFGEQLGEPEMNGLDEVLP